MSRWASDVIVPCRRRCGSPGRARVAAAGGTKRRVSVSSARDRLAHHAVVHALAPLVAEASLFEEASGAVVEEGCRDLLAKVSCGYASTAPPPACAIDQSTTKCDRCHSFAPVLLVHEEAGRGSRATCRGRPRTAFGGRCSAAPQGCRATGCAKATQVSGSSGLIVYSLMAPRFRSCRHCRTTCGRSTSGMSDPTERVNAASARTRVCSAPTCMPARAAEPSIPSYRESARVHLPRSGRCA